MGHDMACRIIFGVMGMNGLKLGLGFFKFRDDVSSLADFPLFRTGRSGPLSGEVRI